VRDVKVSPEAKKAIRRLYTTSSKLLEIDRVDCAVLYNATDVREMIEIVCCFNGSAVQSLCIDWQWRNFFNFIYASWSGRHDVGQGNVNNLQQLHSDLADLALCTKLFVSLYRQLALQHRDRRLLWRHFIVSIQVWFFWRSRRPGKQQDVRSPQIVYRTVAALLVTIIIIIISHVIFRRKYEDWYAEETSDYRQ